MASLAMRIVSRRVGRVVAQTRRGFAEAAAPAAAQPDNMVFTFSSPVEAYYNNSTDVKQVDVPTGAGVVGILARHVPIFGVLKPGLMTVFENDGKAVKFFVSSGSFSVNEDSTVQIVAEEAVPVEQLDKDAARNNLTKAQSALTSAANELERAEAQIEIECNEAIIAATA